jgi:hypothetical protein
VSEPALDGTGNPVGTPLPNPATTPVPKPPFPHGLTRRERDHLRTFDELDFVIFSHADWARMGESHAENIRVHVPDGSFTDGLDAHVATLQALFAWASDTSISEHPIRVAKNDLTAVTGVMRGTFNPTDAIAERNRAANRQTLRDQHGHRRAVERTGRDGGGMAVLGQPLVLPADRPCLRRCFKGFRLSRSTALDHQRRIVTRARWHAGRLRGSGAR